MKFFISAIFLIFSFCAGAQIDKDIPARPNPPKLVNDLSNTLTASQIQALENKLVAYDDSTSSQIAVVLIPTLNGNDISDYALALGRKWQIGGSEFNNGVLIVVAVNDHKVRIEVGYGLEGAIPDITAKSIIDNSLTPNFKEANYYRGLDKATDDIIRAAAGEYKAPTSYKTKKGKGPGFGSIIGLIVLLLIFGGLGGGRSSGRGGGGGAMSSAGWMILGSMLGSGGRGGGGGGGGGGGFGGFGGGSFGGGGASGSW